DTGTADDDGGPPSEKYNVVISREILGHNHVILTKYAPPITYNEFTYQSEGVTGHRGLFMSGEIYIDVVFGANLLMDYILLRVLGMALGLRRRPGRCLAAAFVGALFSCLVLWFPKEAFPAAVILHGLRAAGMIRIGFGVKKGALLLNTVFMLYAAAFLWGGFREALEDGEGSARTFLLCALCVYAGT